MLQSEEIDTGHLALEQTETWGTSTGLSLSQRLRSLSSLTSGRQWGRCAVIPSSVIDLEVHMMPLSVPQCLHSLQSAPQHCPNSKHIVSP